MRNTFARLIIGALLFVGAGCASAPKLSQAELDAHARATFPGTTSDVFWVPSRNELADAGRISRLNVDPGAASPELVQLLRSANQSPVHLLVSSPNSTLARHEVVAALSRAGATLSKLQVSFIGDPAEAALIRAAVEKVGGKYVDPK